MTGLRNPHQAAEFKELYLQGETLQQIGDFYGISRERVRQVLKKIGITGKDGGSTVRAKKRAETQLLKRRKNVLLKWGCTLEQYEYLRSLNRDYTKTPIYKYAQQRRGAKNRGIGFYLTLWQWWEIWQKSGKYSRRGREYDQYVMCRYMDDGPYEVGNVFIATASENVSCQHKAQGVDKSWMKKNDLPIDEFIITHCEESKEDIH